VDTRLIVHSFEIQNSRARSAGYRFASGRLLRGDSLATLSQLWSLLASVVERNFAIDDNRHEFIGLCDFELHDPMTTPRQLSLSAWLLGVLFDCLVLCPPTVNAAVFKCWRLVRRTGTDRPSTLTEVFVLN
jgi:hypothetical protein